MSNSRWVLIILILLFGATSRILHITDQSLWVDEGYAYYHAHFPSLIETLARDTHPPLYFASLRLWSELAGQSELALRWFSVLPSMLSLAVIFQLAKEILHHRKISVGTRHVLSNAQKTIPILAMLIVAIADAENFLAQESRHYTWVVLLVSCSMWFFLRWNRTENRRDYGLWVSFTTAMVYTHYITAFIGIVQGVYSLVVLREKKRIRAIGGLILSALALMPWLLLVGVRQLGNDGANWSVPLSDVVIQDILTKYFTEQWVLIFGLICLGCVTLIYQERDSYHVKLHRVTILLILWLILPFVLTVIVNEVLLLPFLQPRRLTQWTPVIALLVAFGLSNIRQPIQAMMIAVLLFYGVTHIDFYRPKPDWRTISDLTARYVMPDDLVLTDIDGGDYQMQYYLTRDLPDGKLLDDEVRYESLKLQRDFYSETYHEWLPQTIDAHNTVWLMYWSDDLSGRGWLDNLGFQESAHFTYVHDTGVTGEVTMSIFRFDRLEPSQPIAEFENGMRLLSAEIDNEDLRVDLLWTTDTSLDRDYKISAKLLDSEGVLVAQLDSQPQLNQRPTTTWQANELIYSPHELQLRDGLPTVETGDYQVVVQVYYVDATEIVNIPYQAAKEWVTINTISID
jgi:hypothetical protein